MGSVSSPRARRGPKTLRKYVAPAEAAGLVPGRPRLSRAEWAVLVARWFPWLVDAYVRSLTFGTINADPQRIRTMLATNTVSTVHQQLRDEHGLKASMARPRRGFRPGGSVPTHHLPRTSDTASAALSFPRIACSMSRRCRNIARYRALSVSAISGPSALESRAAVPDDHPGLVQVGPALDLETQALQRPRQRGAVPPVVGRVRARVDDKDTVG